MTKVSRTFRIDQKLSTALDKLYTRHGDNTFHVEQALSQYGPIKALEKPVVKTKAVVVQVDDGQFEEVWIAYGKKGNKKTSKAKYAKLSLDEKVALYWHVPKYVLSTPDKQYRKDFQTYINQECWNDEVIPNGQQNQSNGVGGSNKLSAVERVRATNEAKRAARRDSGGHMADTSGHIRQFTSEPVRPSDAGSVGITIEGSHTKTD